jgi:hypothetical protein
LGAARNSASAAVCGNVEGTAGGVSIDPDVNCEMSIKN